MARRGKRTQDPKPGERIWRDKPPDEYDLPNLNPYLKVCWDYGRPILRSDDAADCRGRWSEEFGREAPLHVEIGVGNGFFFSGMAQQHPERNWLGIEIRFKRVWLTAKKLRALESEPQGRLVRYDAGALSDLFAPGEIDALYVNHPDPWPRDRQAKNRLLGPAFMDMCAVLLAEGAQLRLKTDHRINVDAVVEAANAHPAYRVIGVSEDIEAEGTPWGEDIVTNYQRKFYERGEPVYAVQVERVAG
jgi:tRNA (guanine-N7-)-methyltransferase